MSIRRSTITVDLITFSDAEILADDGLGVFQEVNGRFNIRVKGTGIESIDKGDLHPLQDKYKMESGFNEDNVITPTLASIRSGNIPMPFRVQHSADNPTHEMDWREDEFGRDYPYSYPVLLGTFLLGNTEVTFDYNLH